MASSRECFACGRRITGKLQLVRVFGEDTQVFVGPDCYRHVQAAGETGYRPPRGGARLVPIGSEAK